MASIRQAPFFDYTNFKCFCRCSSLRQFSSVPISGAHFGSASAPEIESQRLPTAECHPIAVESGRCLQAMALAASKDGIFWMES